MLVVDRDAVDGVNRIDEAITFATLPAFKAVVAGEMVATVKIVPFGVESKLRDEAVAIARRMPLKVVPFKLRKIGIVSTLLPGLATQGGGEDAAGDGRPPGAGRRQHSGRAARAAR